jgi:organic hydroperoxide reductase OsmC/OhrA
MRAVAVRAKELRFAIELTAGGELREEHGVALDTPPEWSAEHLLLAALVRCSLKSLRYHARLRGLEVGPATGSARTLVTKRETDDRYAIVDVDVELEVEIEPEPELEALTGLLTLAERDCFIGSSLTAPPSYRWAVNGHTIDS